MKHSVPALLRILGLLCLCLLPSLASAQGRQLLRNGNFDNLLEGWNLEQHSPALGDITITDEGPDGARAVKIELVEPGDDHWKMGFTQYPIALRADKRYRISFMAKADQPRWLAVGLMQHHAPYRVLASNASVEVGTTWARVTILLRPSADETNGRFSIGNLGKIVGSIWVTDVRMIED